MDSSLMSLSGSLRKRGPTQCFCSKKPILVVSWTPDNLGRRFYGCPNYWVRQCLWVFNFGSTSGSNFSFWVLIYIRFSFFIFISSSQTPLSFIYSPFISFFFYFRGHLNDVLDHREPRISFLKIIIIIIIKLN